VSKKEEVQLENMVLQDTQSVQWILEGT